VAEIVRLLGGDLSVDSTPGEGSRFELRIPRTYRPTRPTPADGMAAVAGQPEESRHV